MFLSCGRLHYSNRYRFTQGFGIDVGVAVVTFLSLNRDVLIITLRRSRQYFAYFLPLLLIGLASSIWSLEFTLSLSLALETY